MGKQQRVLGEDAPADDLDGARIPTLKPALRTATQSARSRTSGSVQNARPRPTSDAARSSQRARTDAEVLKLLEQRRAGTGSANDQAARVDIAMLAPEDTNTRLVLREAVARNAPVSFAVQLQWSVQPIDVKSVPRHPLFQAYTLYAAEGRRTGRVWFFLRLGFFSDATSAKQVAQYLRKDFASAAVVPVSPQERQQIGQKGHCEKACTVALGPDQRSG